MCIKTTTTIYVDDVRQKCIPTWIVFRTERPTETHTFSTPFYISVSRAIFQPSTLFASPVFPLSRSPCSACLGSSARRLVCSGRAKMKYGLLARPVTWPSPRFKLRLLPLPPPPPPTPLPLLVLLRPDGCRWLQISPSGRPEEVLLLAGWPALLAVVLLAHLVLDSPFEVGALVGLDVCVHGSDVFGVASLALQWRAAAGRRPSRQVVV